MQNGKSKLMISKDQIIQFLNEIPDPEIPVISIVELGMINNVRISDEKVIVELMPTYTGCPATSQIEKDIVHYLNSKGINNVKVELVYTPTWTTDWISENAKEKLKKYGISPPLKSHTEKGFLIGKSKKIECPRCDSNNTELISQFGSTACKALYKCNSCLEPFDYFKCI